MIVPDLDLNLRYHFPGTSGAATARQDVRDRLERDRADFRRSVRHLHRDTELRLEVGSPAIWQRRGSARCYACRWRKPADAVTGIEQHPDHRGNEIERLDMPLADQLGI